MKTEIALVTSFLLPHLPTPTYHDISLYKLYLLGHHLIKRETFKIREFHRVLYIVGHFIIQLCKNPRIFNLGNVTRTLFAHFVQ